MKKMALALAIVMFAGSVSFADDLVPATSDDVQEFDQQVAKSKSPDSESQEADSGSKPAVAGKSADHSKQKSKKDNFGSLVSAEAKKLKDESVDQRKEMGQWVSSQRSKNSQAQGGSDEHGGTASSGSARDSRDSSPAVSDHGGSGSHGGQSGSHNPNK